MWSMPTCASSSNSKSLGDPERLFREFCNISKHSLALREPVGTQPVRAPLPGPQGWTGAHELTVIWEGEVMVTTIISTSPHLQTLFSICQPPSYSKSFPLHAVHAIQHIGCIHPFDWQFCLSITPFWHFSGKADYHSLCILGRGYY